MKSVTHYQQLHNPRPRFALTFHQVVKRSFGSRLSMILGIKKGGRFRPPRFGPCSSQLMNATSGKRHDRAEESVSFSENSRCEEKGGGRTGGATVAKPQPPQSINLQLQVIGI